MGQAIGDSITLAIGVAISPIPIIAIILMLLSKKAGANSLAFALGWVVGVAGLLTVVIAAVRGDRHRIWRSTVARRLSGKDRSGCPAAPGGTAQLEEAPETG